MQLSKDSFEQIRRWVRRNGREIDIALWRFYFENGGQQAVLDALASYQNPDGGFAHGLEPDCWNPRSTPYETNCALEMLHAIGMHDPTHPICQGILRYLASGDGSNGDLWLFTVPGNNDAPHAIWWEYSDETNAKESLGLSAMLSVYALRMSDPASVLYQRGLRVARMALDALLKGELTGEMAVGSSFALMPLWMELNMVSDPQALISTLSQTALARVVTDRSQWSGYVPRPSAVAFSPESPLYPALQSAVSDELDFYIETLPENDVWPINWNWSHPNPNYAGAFAISANWAKSGKAIGILKFLQAFDRLA